MKNFIIIACICVFAIGCSNPASTKEVVTDTVAASTAEKIEYAYLPKGHPPDNWDRGDQKNVALVLKALKAYENGNIEETVAPFADSVHWIADGYDAKVSKDSLHSMLKSVRDGLKSLKVQMEDYEAVISKDKTEQFVTLWYTEITTDKAGKIDSLSCVDDARIENGKIVSLDEHSRKAPAKK